MTGNEVLLEDIKGKKRLLVCDVCDTLFYSNTTFDFIRFVVAKRSIGKKIAFSLINEKWSPLFYAVAIFSRITTRDWAKYLSLLFLKGLSRAEAMQLANSFYDLVLLKRKITPVFQMIERERNESEIILASSSIDIVVRVVAERNKIKFVASELEIKEDRLTGRILTDQTGRKHATLQPYLHNVELSVITDNRTDLELVRLADHRYIVISSQTEKTFWANLGPTFIEK